MRFLFNLPFITLKVGSDEVEALIDTGFNGDLALPLPFIQKAGLRQTGAVEHSLADGSPRISAIYEGKVQLLGKNRRVEVMAADIPLLGMQLLYETRMLMIPKKNVLQLSWI